MPPTGQAVHDPVYGAIYPSPLEWALIRSPSLQRLRSIQQLGLVDLVYPGAVHTRLEHSIGTMHIAGRMAEHLGLEAEDVAKVRIAGLLHDLGHSAFSHAVESVLSRNPELQPSLAGSRASRHEQFTRFLITSHDFGPHALGLAEEEFGSPSVSFQEIAEIALGGRPPLGQIISGELDGDRIDFLLRDSHHTGVSLGLVDVDQIIQSLCLFQDRVVLAGDGDYRSDLSLTAAESMLIARAHHYNALIHHPGVQSARSMLLQVLDGVLESMAPEEAKAEVFRFFTQYGDADLLHFLWARSDGDRRRILERLKAGKLCPLKARFDHRSLPPGVRMALSTISRNGGMAKLFASGMQKRYRSLVDISVGSGVPRSTRTRDGFLYDESSLAAGLIRSLTRQITLSFFGDSSVDITLEEVESLASKLLSFIREESYLPIEGLLLLFYTLHRMLSQVYGGRILVPRIRNITWLYRTVSSLKELGREEPGLAGLYDYAFHSDYGFPYSERLFEDIQILVAMGMVYQDQRHYPFEGRWTQRYEYMLTAEGLAYAGPIASAYHRELALVEANLKMGRHTIPYDMVSLLLKKYMG